MNDENESGGGQAPFIYAVILTSGEVFAVHKNPRVAEGIAKLEREYSAGCRVIPLYTSPQSIYGSEHKPD